MSTTAQREDLHSEKSILQFASRFNSKLLLDMIYLLTYADMRGVGKGVYTNFNARLIRTLYRASIDSLKHDKMLSITAKKLNKQDTLKKSAEFLSLPRVLQKKILSIPSNEFFIDNTKQRVLEIAQNAMNTGKYSYEIGNREFLTIEIIRRDKIHLGYLLSKLNRLQVVKMEIVKLFDGLKYFKIDFSDKIDESELTLVEYTIEDAFRSDVKPKLIKPSITKEQIEIECDHSREYATMRIRTADQKGMLAYTIALFDSLDIDIATAKIHTIKSRVNDLFLIEKDGNFCHNTDNIINNLTESVCVE